MNGLRDDEYMMFETSRIKTSI